MPTIDQIRRVSYLARLYGMKVPVVPVCKNHQSPGHMLAQLVYDDHESLTLWSGPRGGGKSALSGLANYWLGQWYPEFEAKILGGSQAQSQQIYRAMELFRKNRPEADAIREMLKTEAWFRSGGHVEILTASDKSVRGPHVPRLSLDEVDEIENAVREASYGMVMRKGNLAARISMTSTWHRVAGPMADLMKRGQDGEFPVGVFCMFDVLERCPEERSGPDLEKCPDCPIVRWCHSDIDEPHAGGKPKAKRSCGHYDIDAFIQKARGLSTRIFESDYLCLRPRAQGAWFTDFDPQEGGRHVTEKAEYRPGQEFCVSIDPGVHTAAVWFHCRVSADRTRAEIVVFGDYYAEHLSGGASAHAQAIMERTSELTGVPIQSARVSMDPAGRQANAVGPTVSGEYKRMGCVGKPYPTIHDWPLLGPARPKADSLQLVESLLLSAGGVVSLTIHPRCKHLIEALETYLRKQTPDGQFLDEPKDPCHPAEDSVDALAGGLSLELPDGLAPATPLMKVPARRLV